MKNLSATEKPLAIKTKVVERIKKEYQSYEKELTKETEKLAFLNSTNEGPAKIKHQEALMEETRSVFFTVKANLINEKENLEKMLDDNTDDQLPATETWARAKTVLAEVNAFIDEHVLKTN